MSQPDLRDLSEADQARLARALIRKQASLGLRVAALFLGVILGLPLLNAAIPDAMNEPWIGGFTATWLLLGVLLYPIAVALSFYFVAASDRIEAECADWQAMLAEEEAR